MTSHKRRAEHTPLFGMAAASRPEWQAQRDDAREREVEKTRMLRAARLAAQAKPAKPAPPPSAAPKSRKKDFGAVVRDRRAHASIVSE